MKHSLKSFWKRRATTRFTTPTKAHDIGPGLFRAKGQSLDALGKRLGKTRLRNEKDEVFKNMLLGTIVSMMSQASTDMNAIARILGMSERLYKEDMWDQTKSEQWRDIKQAIQIYRENHCAMCGLDRAEAGEEDEHTCDVP